MKLKTLRLENFQGIRHAEFAFDGRSASIYGDNATGKTTVFNAVTYLLFDRASTGAKGFTPKTNGTDGDLHNLDHTAEAVCVMGDGSLVTFRKTFHEVYKKKRGSAAETFDGHTVDYYIDGVPVKEKEYNTAVCSFCGGLERMKILTMPDYFPETMDWRDRRKILLELCGNVSDDDVIDSSPELRELRGYLLVPGTKDQYYAVEDYQKKAEAQKREINRELQGIPGRIDEAQRAIPADAEDVSYIPMALAQLRREREELEAKKADAVSGNTALAEARKRTAEAEAALAKARSDYLARASQGNDAILSQITAIAERRIRLQEESDELRRRSANKDREAERLSEMRTELRSQWAKEKTSVFDASAEICPTCGQRLPPERIDTMREEFNLRKSKRLEEIQAKGKSECNETMIKNLHCEAQADREAAGQKSEEAGALQRQIDALRSQMNTVPVFEGTGEYQPYAAEIAVCRAAEAAAGKNTSSAVQDAEDALRGNQEEIERLQHMQTQAVQAQTQRKRIRELEDRETELGAAFENLEHGLYLCDEFTREKVRLLTEGINEKFHSVRFRLFQEQVNGGLKEDCEALVPGKDGALVPFHNANNAARINAGLEIIGALSRHWDMDMPVFIDNAESVTHLAATAGQTIRLVVSEPDKQLRLELE